MFTVITETQLNPGQEEQWDHAFQARIMNAGEQPGWLGIDVLIPTDDRSKRVVIGTWRSQEDWDRWHETDVFQQTRPLLAAATKSDGQPQWFNVGMSMIQAVQK